MHNLNYLRSVFYINLKYSMNNGTQQRLTRIRPPRVKICFEVETEGSAKKITLPFISGVISDLAGDNDKTNTIENEFVTVDFDTFNSYMRSVLPTLNYATQDFKVALTFQSIFDFGVQSVVQQIPALNEMNNIIDVFKHVCAILDGNNHAIETFKTLLEGDLDSSIQEMEALLKGEENQLL